MFRTFLLIASPIIITLLIANFLNIKVFNNDDLVAKRIQKDIENNPTASNIDESILKRVVIYNENNGLVEEQVIYEESILSQEEYNELKNELE